MLISSSYFFWRKILFRGMGRVAYEVLSQFWHQNSVFQFSFNKSWLAVVKFWKWVKLEISCHRSWEPSGLLKPNLAKSAYFMTYFMTSHATRPWRHRSGARGMMGGRKLSAEQDVGPPGVTSDVWREENVITSVFAAWQLGRHVVIRLLGIMETNMYMYTDRIVCAFVCVLIADYECCLHQILRLPAFITLEILYLTT